MLQRKVSTSEKPLDAKVCSSFSFLFFTALTMFVQNLLPFVTKERSFFCFAFGSRH
jgi:hypothetical protein